MNLDLPHNETAIVSAHAPEAELISAAKKCPDAFGPLYDLYYTKILNYIYRRTLNSEVAEELTSNTFFHAMRALPKYEDRGYFSAWLYRIATNEINAYRRGRGACAAITNNSPPAVLDRVWFDSPKLDLEEDVEEKLRTFARLHAAVDCLPEKYQEAISLRYFEALSYEDIAQVMDKRLGTVKSLVHRGLIRLQRHFGREIQ